MAAICRRRGGVSIFQAYSLGPFPEPNGLGRRKLDISVWACVSLTKCPSIQVLGIEILRGLDEVSLPKMDLLLWAELDSSGSLFGLLSYLYTRWLGRGCSILDHPIKRLLFVILQGAHIAFLDFKRRRSI